MLPKSTHISKKSEFDAIYSSRKVLSSQNFRLNFDFEGDPEGTHPDVAIVVSKKLGKAHDRNLLKRRSKAVFRTTPLWEVPNLRIVVTAKPTATELDYSLLDLELRGLLGKIRY